MSIVFQVLFQQTITFPNRKTMKLKGGILIFIDKYLI